MPAAATVSVPSIPPPIARTAYLLVVLVAATASLTLSGQERTAAPVDRSGALPFIPNTGQHDAAVRYTARGPGFVFHFTQRAALLSLVRGDRGATFRLGFLGANQGVALAGAGELPAKVNYLHGSDPRAWHTGLSTYGEIRYTDLWPGIDMVVRGSGGRLKYEFHVSPGARVGDIGLGYSGIDHLGVGAAGGLLVHTPIGVLRDAPPVSYQEISGRRVPVESRYAVRGEHAYGFAVGAHDPRRPLVIDPGLRYSTFLGGNDQDAGFDTALDASGNAYLTGYAYSADFPTTPGAFDTSHNGNSDAFVSKLDTAGALVYSTYLGGGSTDSGHAIAVDAAGSAYVTGATYSQDFPTTPGAFDTTRNGAASVEDAFVTKLDPSGGTLSYSTFLGGFSLDRGDDVAVDGLGNTYVAGGTGSSDLNDFPTTPGAFDTTPSINGDAFVTKINPAGSGLVYSTLLGGDGGEEVVGIVLDAAGSAYAAGDTNSTDFPMTVGAFDTTFSGQVERFATDEFLTKLSPSGSSLSYSTYLGGNRSDFPSSVAVDGSGSAYTTGTTFSQDFPTTSGAFDTTHSAVSFDGYVTKLNPAGSALSYSTFLGGLDFDGGNGVAVGADGSAYVAGRTISADFPVAPDGFDTTLDGDDAFVTRLNPAGSDLTYSTFLGGADFDSANGIEFAGENTVIVGGITGSSDFPATPGAFDTTFNGQVDAFATKLELGALPSSTPGCTTSDHGRIVAANGDQAMFRGRSRVSREGVPSGVETYRDRGPVDRFTLRSTAVDALVCDRRNASIFGRALVDGADTTFQIDLHDGGGRKRDTYRIVLGIGFDSGVQPLTSGHVKVKAR